MFAKNLLQTNGKDNRQKKKTVDGFVKIQCSTQYPFLKNFIRYGQRQKIGKPNNIKDWDARKPNKIFNIG